MMSLSAEQAEAIQEMINIGFGRAVSAVAQILNSRLELSVPYVTTLDSEAVAKFLINDFPKQDEVHLVQQSFYGNFLGEAALVLPVDSSHTLVRMLSSDLGYSPGLDPDLMEQEVLLEIGNLVIGASLGQFAELLNTRVSFKPPQVLRQSLRSDNFQRRVSENKEAALLVRTSFQMTEENLSGNLFFFLSSRCQEWLIQEIDRFLEELM